MTFQPSSLNNKTRFTRYKYFINHPDERFIASILNTHIHIPFFHMVFILYQKKNKKTLFL